MNDQTTRNVDPHEVNKFDKLADHWWALQGELKTLHQINPLRLGFIEENTPLFSQKVLDVGCGGGILCEAMAKKGANVTGIDQSEAAILAAKAHSEHHNLSLQYHVTTVEEMAASAPQSFDVVTCLEMLEHVPQPASVIRACATLVKPGGHAFFSTLNRNPKAYLFAILGAEYLLNILPKGTHDYARFIKPSELANWSREAGLAPQETKGIRYHPFTEKFSLCDDISVNYLLHAIKS